MTLWDDPPEQAEDSEAGYRRPPKATRFTKGQSGNPAGRPRGRRREAPYEAILGQMVTIREDGTTRRVTAAEAFLLKLTKSGLEGDSAAARASLAAIEHAREQHNAGLGGSRISAIVREIVGPGSVASALQPLRMARKLDPYRETAQIALEPWLVEAALARLDRRLSPADQRTIMRATQQFNTTTSMGRLTLNVLLSFAQFEREVTSERIRDKIAASKRKGLWVGGPLPLGYHMNDDKIAVIEDEAERVRLIYRRYLELGSVNALVRDLRERNVRTKARLLATGATRGGVPFGRGSLFYLLRNRFYIDEVKYKDEILPGEQPAIMDRALFDAVQSRAYLAGLESGDSQRSADERVWRP